MLQEISSILEKHLKYVPFFVHWVEILRHRANFEVGYNKISSLIRGTTDWGVERSKQLAMKWDRIKVLRSAVRELLWEARKKKDQLILMPEKAMAPHSSTLAWKLPWTEESGRLQSTGSLRVRHDWATSLPLFTFMHWRRKWQPTPVFLPGESQGRGSLVGCRLWGCTESDTTEAT